MPSRKKDFIDYVVDVLQHEPSDTSESDLGVHESERTEISRSEPQRGHTDRPRSGRSVRPESARGRTQDDAEGNVKQKQSRYSKFKSFARKATGYSSTADMSTLLSDLKHVSENGASFASNIDSADAYAPPI